MRQDLEMWTAAGWRKVYGFPIRDEGMATQRKKFVEEIFTHLCHPKDECHRIARIQRLGGC